jgi:ribosome maturation factor RimP
MKPAELEKIIAPAVTALGFELIHCIICSERGQPTFRVFIDHPQGVTVEDCARVTRQINSIMEVSAPEIGGYHLEVSSPGLDRPLLTPEHYQRFIGNRIKITLRQPNNDGRKNFTGELLAITADQQVELRVDKEIFILNLNDIEKANLIPDLRF